MDISKTRIILAQFCMAIIFFVGVFTALIGGLLAIENNVDLHSGIRRTFESSMARLHSNHMAGINLAILGSVTAIISCLIFVLVRSKKGAQPIAAVDAATTGPRH